MAQRTACIDRDHFTFTEPVANFSVGIGMKSDLNQPPLDGVPTYDLNARPLGPVLHRRTGNRYAAAPVGVDRSASKHSEPKRRVTLQ